MIRFAGPITANSLQSARPPVASSPDRLPLSSIGKHCVLLPIYCTQAYPCYISQYMVTRCKPSQHSNRCSCVGLHLAPPAHRITNGRLGSTCKDHSCGHCLHPRLAMRLLSDWAENDRLRLLYSKAAPKETVLPEVDCWAAG